MSALTPTWSIIAAVLVAASVGVFCWFLGERHDETPSWLFSQTAHSGSPEDKGDGTVVLTLNDIDAHTIGFTDRPDRDSAILMTQDFVESWPTMFADSPPNAVLVEHRPDGEANSVILTLETPKLAGSTLTFKASVPNEEVPQSAAKHAGTLHPTPPETFEAASLFIDSVPCEADEPTGTCSPGDRGLGAGVVAP